MQALALPKVPACLPEVARRCSAARNRSAHRSPVNPRPPTRKISRRLMPSQRRTLEPRMESMDDPPGGWRISRLHYKVCWYASKSFLQLADGEVGATLRLSFSRPFHGNRAADGGSRLRGSEATTRSA